jgi:hypothetical protein
MVLYFLRETGKGRGRVIVSFSACVKKSPLDRLETSPSHVESWADACCAAESFAARESTEFAVRDGDSVDL